MIDASLDAKVNKILNIFKWLWNMSSIMKGFNHGSDNLTKSFKVWSENCRQSFTLLKLEGILEK